MNTLPGNPSFRRRLLANMPAEVADSFTELQLEMIEHALERGPWQGHVVDVRLSVPLLWRRFYLVILAGPERRSAQRREGERARHPLWTVANTILIALFILLSIPAILGLIQILRMT